MSPSVTQTLNKSLLVTVLCSTALQPPIQAPQFLKKTNDAYHWFNVSFSPLTHQYEICNQFHQTIQTDLDDKDLRLLKMVPNNTG